MHRNNLHSVLLKMLDLIIVCSAFGAAYLIRKNLFVLSAGKLSREPNYLTVFLLIIIICHVTFSLFKLNRHYGKKVDWSIFFSVIQAVSASLMILLSSFFIFKISEFSRILISVYWLLEILFLTAVRWIAYKCFNSRKNSPYFIRNFLIFGNRETAKEIIEIINRTEATKVIGCLETDPSCVGKEVAGGIRVIGVLENLRDILLSRVIDEIIITMPLNSIKDSGEILALIRTFGIRTRIIPQWYVRKFLAEKPHVYAMDIEKFISEPAFVLSTNPIRRDSLLIKSIMDYSGAALLLLIFLPVFLLVPLAVKITSKGPVFFKQKRSGLYGRIFTIYKFRTMMENADIIRRDLLLRNEADGPAFKIKDDPRIIPVIGKFLRRTGFDELPQIFNVLTGRMSLVGPRPALPFEVQSYELRQRKRLSMKPGITCIWQVQSRRNEIPFSKWMEMDLEYINNWSLGLDLKLLLMSVPAVILGRGR